MSDPDLPTRDGPVRPRSDKKEEPRFLPGAILAGRYRIVSPLGRGGMGEVYRADDTKLGQPVALKFLPRRLSDDPERRQRLLDEVRLARQVAHPSVCHVWDVGEVDDHDFIAMEYVDGEDLASLLRRIGRLPEERAVRMARELCAALAAAHDQGILHRDLKPANVMVDGRGRVKLADFGLAAVAADLDGTDVRSGTPSYMSPEQLAGREVTIRSDVYALGLVLYELFTGQVAYPAKTLAEAVQRAETPLSRPSSHVHNLDPAIERAIERCLETDPELRPSSATAVAAALPGGDPLAAALAAGETPSPELVAAAGGSPGMAWPRAVAVAGAVALGLAVAAILADRGTPYTAALGDPPEVLAHEAQQLMVAVGAEGSPADRAHGFFFARREDQTSRLLFWYRTSPRSLAENISVSSGPLSFRNPAAVVPGMSGVLQEPRGPLIEYVRVPTGEDTARNEGPGFGELLARTGLDVEALTPVPPEAVPPHYADTRVAWTSSGGRPVRVEGASLRGWPVWLRVRPEGADANEDTPAVLVQSIYMSFGILVFAAVVARRNHKLGRSDTEGALRVAALGVFVTFGFLSVPRALAPPIAVVTVSLSVFFTLAFWLTYLALEPMVRKRWPDTLTTWTRLLSGRLLDPLLGRHLLFGALAGVTLSILEIGGRIITGIDSGQWAVAPDLLLGGWTALGGVVRGFASILPSFVALLMLAVVRQITRSIWPALLFTLAFTAFMFGDLETPAGAVMSLAFMALFLGVLIRLGLLAAGLALIVHSWLAHSMLTTRLSEWYADSAVAGILATAALTAWGFYAATGPGRSATASGSAT